ncbi:Acetyltransferase [Burkholderia dolosa AU0158]|nr:Acetyltransferase [Burkholderia dolosa AU0158]
MAGTLAPILGSEFRLRSTSYGGEMGSIEAGRARFADAPALKKDMNMQLQNDAHTLSLRPLERDDLRFVHELNNDAKIMRYWFEEPYETFAELSQLYDRHVHDQRERRFVAIDAQRSLVGLVELIELDYIHRRGEFQIIIAPHCQGRGYAGQATRLAVEYAFRVLNLRKLYLIVDTSNAAAIHVYEKCGFQHEAELKEEFFGNGTYHNAYRMCIFQRDYFERRQTN